MSFSAAFAVVCFVSLVRAELEAVTSLQAGFAAGSLVNNAAFYTQSFAIFALLASRFTGKPLERVIGVATLGVFLGVLPPLFDLVIGGTNSGYYRYVSDGFARWSFTLINPAHYSTGEALVLWMLVAALPGYVLYATRSSLRTLGALAASYAGVTFIAMVPSTLATSLAALTVNPSSPLWLSLLTAIQVVAAQAAYLLCRPPLLHRLSRRFVHAGPFIAVTLLGSTMSAFGSSAAFGQTARLRCALGLGILTAVLCVIALVQNDAYDAQDDRRSLAVVSTEDANFFTLSGVVLVLGLSIGAPAIGAPMAIFFCASIVYSFHFYRAKRWFPANYKIEGAWAWSSYLLGGSGTMALLSDRRVSAPWLWGSLAVFAGWSLFNVFKDYKDIRRDYHARIQTLYVLALRRRISLRRLHRTLGGAFLTALCIPGLGLVALGASWLEMLLVTCVAAVCFYRILSLPPAPRAVRWFLIAVTGYVGLLWLCTERALGGGS